MAYTFTQKTPATEPGEENNFGGIATDGNRVAMTGAIGAGPQTVDATASPQSSPLSVATNSVTTLKVPANAVQVNFLASSNSVNISEADNTVASKYFTVPTGVQTTVDVARCASLFMEANTGTSTLSFWFNVV